jgi:diacylglycerol kinase (ATP)
MPRNDRERICLIMNPRSAGGATGRRLNAVKDAAARHFARWEVRLTRGPGHATELAVAAAEEGFDVVAAVGGDGTASEVVNGLFDGERARGHCAFTVVPAGTGSDLIKTLRIPKDLERAMAAAATGTDKRSDLMAVEVEDPDGKRITRISVNVTGFGMNGEVVQRANRSSKRLGGTLTFFGAAVSTIRSFEAPDVEITWTGPDGAAGRYAGPLWAAFVGNGAYCGGGMMIGAGGSMQDGVAELTIVPPVHGRDLARGLTRIYNGRLGEIEGVVVARVQQLDAVTTRAPAPVLIDVDGEQPGVLPARLKVLREVLVVRGLW